MKIGQKVKVYQKPFTDEELEGIGIIKEIEKREGVEGAQRCIIAFPTSDGYNEHVSRLIFERNIIE